MNSEDCISRAKLIQTLDAWDHDVNAIPNYAWKVIRETPSVTNVLDKIRAEIIENSIEDYKYHGCGSDELIIGTNEVLNIIDKYKSESENKK